MIASELKVLESKGAGLRSWCAFIKNQVASELKRMIQDQVSLAYINDYMLTERSYNWTQITGLPFDPFECAREMTSRGVECPKCFDRLSVRECLPGPLPS